MTNITKKIFLIIFVIIFFILSLIYIEKIILISQSNINELFINEEKILDDLKFQLTSQSITLCTISFTPPWFVVYNPGGTYLLIIDSRGNMFINSTLINSTTPTQTGWRNAFIIRDSTGIAFAVNSSLAQIKGSINENALSFPTSNSFIIRNSTHILASFDGTNFYIRGRVVYNGRNGLCYDGNECYKCISNRTVYNYRCWNGICEHRCATTCLSGYSCVSTCAI